MPTILRAGPYRFYFYSHEPNEPAHIHVDRDDCSAKFWLEGTEVEEGRRILASSDLDIITATDLTDGAKRVVAAAR